MDIAWSDPWSKPSQSSDLISPDPICPTMTLPSTTDQDEAKTDWDEILTAKKDLEEKLGKTVNIFSYPYGSMSKSVEDILKSNGFIAAFSTINGSLQCDSLIFSLRRTHIGNAPLSAFGL